MESAVCTLLGILAAMALLLTIACVNVANLMLARGAERRSELAVCAALGASRTRLIGQSLAEAMLLAAAGGASGLVLAYVAVDIVVALSPPELPRAAAIGVDGWALVFAVGLTTLIGLVVGLLPALQGSRASLRTGLHQHSVRVAGGHQVTRRMLVVVQVALALMLSVGAGLLLRSLQQLLAVPPGFDAANVLTLQVQTAGHRFRDPNAIHRFFTAVLESVRQVPGVSAAALTSQLPLTGDEDLWGVHVESPPASAADADRSAYRHAVSPGYFEAMGIPLRKGRLLDAYDLATAPLAVVVSESFARRRLPGVDPVGDRLRIGPDTGPWFTLVGIVGDVRHASLALGPVDAVYVTSEHWTQFADRARWLVVRASGDAAALTPAIRTAIASVDEDQPILRVATMNDRLRASAAERRFALLLFEAFGVVALVLAAIGTYSLLSGIVAERLREIAVRAALGAGRRGILTLVLRQGLSLTAAGIAIGVAAATMATRLLDTLLFGVSRLDPATYLGVVVLFTSMSMIASWIPAWRAARMDPNVVLRGD
jgi:putative ABC transport system permease protein